MSNIVTVNIENAITGQDLCLLPDSTWLQTGDIEGALPVEIKSSGNARFTAKGTPVTGVSGYVIYNFKNDHSAKLTIAFSNPLSGTNKIGIGFGNSKSIWDDMTDHYHGAEFDLSVPGLNISIKVNMKNTPSGINDAHIKLSSY